MRVVHSFLRRPLHPSQLSDLFFFFASTMKLSALLGLLTASVVPLASAVITHPEFNKRQITQACVGDLKYLGIYHGVYDSSGSCAELVSPLSISEFARHVLSYSSQAHNCMTNLNGSGDLWSINSCVAAATCQGVSVVL